MAELADALASGVSGCKAIEVQILLGAHIWAGKYVPHSNPLMAYYLRKYMFYKFIESALQSKKLSVTFINLEFIF